MKKIITFLTAAVLAALPLSAVQTSPEPAAKQETKEFKLSGFHGLDVSWIYQVELTRSARYSVRVEAPDFAMPYLKVKVSDGVLELETEDLPIDIRRRLENNRHQVRVFVSMPELTSLEMSGATKLQASGEFFLQMGGTGPHREQRCQICQDPFHHLSLSPQTNLLRTP